MLNIEDFEIKPIRSQADYDRALAFVETASKGSKHLKLKDKIEVVSDLLEKYDSDNFPQPEVTPGEMLQFCLDNHGLKQKNIVKFFGSQSKVSEAINGKISMSVEQIRKVSEFFKTSPEIFISPENAKATLLLEPGLRNRDSLSGRDFQSAIEKLEERLGAKLESNFISFEKRVTKTLSRRAMESQGDDNHVRTARRKLAARASSEQATAAKTKRA